MGLSQVSATILRGFPLLAMRCTAAPTGRPSAIRGETTGILAAVSEPGATVFGDRFAVGVFVGGFLFVGDRFAGASFAGVVFGGERLVGAVLVEVVLVGVVLVGAVFAGAGLAGVIFELGTGFTVRGAGVLTTSVSGNDPLGGADDSRVGGADGSRGGAGAVRPVSGSGNSAGSIVGSLIPRSARPDVAMSRA